MATTIDDVVAKTEMHEMETKEKMNCNEEKIDNQKMEEDSEHSSSVTGKFEGEKAKEVEGEVKKKDVQVQVEPKTGVSFPVKMEDGKELMTLGLRKKSMLGFGIKIYSFGIYSDGEKLKDLLRSKIEKAPAKPTKDMYQMVIDSDVGTVVKLIIVCSNLTMSMVRKSFDEGLGGAIKKLTGRKNDELTKKIMGEATDAIKLTPGSEIEISRLPGYVLETRVKGEIVSKVESELLCRAYMYLYLGEDPFDKEAKEKFGTTLLSLF